MDKFKDYEIKELIDCDELAKIGVIGEENIILFLKNIKTDLFYLQYKVIMHLMPYVAKIESSLKRIVNEKNPNKYFGLNDSIVEISKKPSLYLNENNWNNNHRLPKNLDRNPYNCFLLLCFLFRNSRNIVMHGSSIFFGQRIREEKLVLSCFWKENSKFKPENFKTLFSINNYKNFINSSSENPSYLSVIILFSSFFIRPQIYKYIMSSVDYEIYSFLLRYKFIRKDKFYQWIGLKEDWINQLKIDLFLKNK